MLAKVTDFEALLCSYPSCDLICIYFAGIHDGESQRLRALCDVILFPFLPRRMEDEAVLDRGATFVKNVCEEEVEGKRSDDHYLAVRSYKCFFHSPTQVPRYLKRTDVYVLLGVDEL